VALVALEHLWRQVLGQVLVNLPALALVLALALALVQVGRREVC
jgi:hypothetical protein